MAERQSAHAHPRLLSPEYFTNTPRTSNAPREPLPNHDLATDAVVDTENSHNCRTETLNVLTVAEEPREETVGTGTGTSESGSTVATDAALQATPYVHGAGALNVLGGRVNFHGNVSFGTGTGCAGNTQSSPLDANHDWSFINYVTSKIGRDIWTLASMLNINEARVEEARYNFNRDLSGACGAIMKAYKEQCRNRPADAKAKLVSVLQAEPLRRNDIADRLSGRH